MVKLGVNVDHVATLREARRGIEPEPVTAALIAELNGADCITVHLREDYRHIKERDVRILREVVQTKLNLEMSLAEEIVKIALEIKPDQITLVPERRAELTTESGLDIKSNYERVKATVEKFKNSGIIVSLFIDPAEESIMLSKEVGADCVELHTGYYANARTKNNIEKELNRIIVASKLVVETKLVLNAGHGLNYFNVVPIARIPGMNELHIGHSIISRAVFVGIAQAVREMKQLLLL